MDALRGLALLLIAQSAGELIARGSGVPLPGPVIGLLLMLLALRRPEVQRMAGAAAEVLLTHLSLLFVPVGVGVMTHVGLITQFGVRMLLVIVVSTWIGLAVTALVMRALLPRPAPA
jgi:holin-like protein